MIVRNVLKLYVNQSMSSIIVRYYSNRNVLKLHERGLFQDIFPEQSTTQAKDMLNAEPQCVYAGFDPTADSLHVGNLLVIVGLLHWQRSGHNTVALIGGATAQVGDPSGRNLERPELAKNYISNNALSIQKDIEKIFINHENFLWNKEGDKSKLNPLKIVNNETWYRGIDAVNFASVIGRHFRMGTMLSRTSVQSRIASETGMSFTEFTYQVFQAYDWLHLFKNHNCRFQLGGSDQMGNIMSGHELISKAANKSVFGLTMPLITSEEGDKFGKSAGNAIWLNEQKTSAFGLYQFFIRSKDSEVGNLLRLFTFDSLGNIKQLLDKHEKAPELRIAQKKLAEEVTLLVHGESGLAKARLASDALYSGNVESLGTLNVDELSSIFQGATTIDVLPSPGMTIKELAMKSKCFPTERDAERIINAGGLYINNNRTTNFSEAITHVHILPNKVTLIRVGKRNYYIVKWLS